MLQIRLYFNNEKVDRNRSVDTAFHLKITICRCTITKFFSNEDQNVFTDEFKALYYCRLIFITSESDIRRKISTILRIDMFDINSKFIMELLLFN